MRGKGVDSRRSILAAEQYLIDYWVVAFFYFNHTLKRNEVKEMDKCSGYKQIEYENV
jgi:hypothetical protein